MSVAKLMVVTLGACFLPTQLRAEAMPSTYCSFTAKITAVSVDRIGERVFRVRIESVRPARSQNPAVVVSKEDCGVVESKIYTASSAASKRLNIGDQVRGTSEINLSSSCIRDGDGAEVKPPQPSLTITEKL